MAEISLGLGTLCGLAREGLVTVPTWPAVAPALVTQALPLLSASLSDGVNVDFGASTRTTRGSEPGVVTRIMPTAHIDLDLRYSGLETLLCLALGAMAKRIDGVALPEPRGGTAYRQLYEMAPTLGTPDRWSADDGVLEADGLAAGLRKVRRGTLALSRGVATWEFLSSVVQQISFALTTEGKATCAVDLAAHSLSRTSSVNTLATMRHLMPSSAPSVLDIDLRLRLGAASPTVALDEADDFGVTAWSLTLQNSCTIEPGPRTGLYAEEIEKSAASGVSGSFTIPRYQNNVLVDAWPAGSLLMLECRFQGPEIPGAFVPYELLFALPAIQLTQALVPLPPGGAPVTVQWYAVEPQEVGAGLPLTSGTSQMALQLITDSAIHPLLAA